MSAKCKCNNFAVYAVGDDAQMMCLLCMLDAVDTEIAIPVRTLDPWEIDPPKNK
ncbi:hypothetical protein [Paenibacillus sp. S150]|uniref:hypothetical protein n=1 Tax=Paenibacillus sp. S150 TaxID=2749826 RepID=UPI001C5A331C|nr:hypothetical protein [Paenibacillus sp. S150]MBW4083579.1 hypothetical protein [Paenibacillus sp. S150]